MDKLSLAFRSIFFFLSTQSGHASWTSVGGNIGFILSQRQFSFTYYLFGDLARYGHFFALRLVEISGAIFSFLPNVFFFNSSKCDSINVSQGFFFLFSRPTLLSDEAIRKPRIFIATTEVGRLAPQPLHRSSSSQSTNASSKSTIFCPTERFYSFISSRYVDRRF